MGFFTLSPLSVGIDPEVRSALGLTDARYARVGGNLLGRLGVAAAHQGQGYGELLVERAIDATRRAQHAVGGAFLGNRPAKDVLSADGLSGQFAAAQAAGSSSSIAFAGWS